MFKKIRVTILLFILFLVGADNYLTQRRATDWDQSLSVVVYPINGDGSPYVEHYISRLTRDVFKPVERFMQEEGARYNLALVDPVLMDMAPQVSALPPRPPFGAGIFAVMRWSLQLRYWAWKNDTYQGPLNNIKVFVLYYEPDTEILLDHSLGLKEGHICMVQGFAGRDREAGNNVIIVHELLHTIGATDKYDPQTLQPIYPGGYGHPERIPLFPQDVAEIMGRAIPLSPSRSTTPATLAETLIGPLTAREIKWLE